MNDTAWQLYAFNARMGLGPFLGGLPYPRYLEYPLALQMGGNLTGLEVLDIGSGRRGRFPLYLLATRQGLRIHSTDLIDYSGEQYRRAEKLGQAAAVPTRFVFERQDATALTYPDESFDRVFALSTIEHIPDVGDTQAMREFARVLRPGGLAVIALPFHARGLQEVRRTVDVSYQAHDEEVFYERRYDLEAVRSRLTKPARFRVERICFYGEDRFPFWSAFYSRILPLPIYLQWLTLPFRLTMPVLVQMFLSVLPLRRIDKALGVVFSVRKSQAAKGVSPSDLRHA